jgi:hypothetical protein
MKPDKKTIAQKLVDGLQAIANEQFPRSCKSCGRFYESPKQYFEDADPPATSNGLQETSRDKQGRPGLQLFRHCPCGSTLLEFFKERRDLSPAGKRRREKFGEVMNVMTKAGLEFEIAQQELLKFLDGQESEIIQEYIQALS